MEKPDNGLFGELLYLQRRIRDISEKSLTIDSNNQILLQSVITQQTDLIKSQSRLIFGMVLIIAALAGVHVADYIGLIG